MQKLGIFIFVIALTLLGCDSKHMENVNPGGLGEKPTEPKPEEPVNPIPDLSEEEKFQEIYTAIIQPKCRACHNENHAGNGVILTTWNEVKNFPGLVVPGKPDESSFYQTIVTDDMPPKDPLAPDLKEMTRKWIAEMSEAN